MLSLAVCWTVGCATQSRVVQPPRDLPVYGDAGKSVETALSVAVYAFPDVAERLSDRLSAIGCSIVAPIPIADSTRPDLVVETVRCAQTTERDAEEVSLVTVVVVRVRKPGALSEDGNSIVGLADARAFQGVSRIPLGRRAFNDERIDDGERSRGVETALDNLMNSGAFVRALAGGCGRTF